MSNKWRKKKVVIRLLRLQLQDLLDNYQCPCHASVCPRCQVSIRQSRELITKTAARRKRGSD